MVLQSTTLLLALTLLLLLSSSVSAQDCNICGDGNFIGFPTGIVSVTYEGQERINNCQTWQGIVKNPVAISDDFCRNEMIYFTADVSTKEMMSIVLCSCGVVTWFGMLLVQSVLT
jgi:hypothetical protein